MDHLFCFCQKIQELAPLKSLDLSNVKSITSMFDGCDLLQSLSGLENWDIGNVHDMTCFCHNCFCLKDILALKNWNVSRVESFNESFENCGLTNLNGLEAWSLKEARTMVHMFADCSCLSDISAINQWSFDLDAILSIQMFDGSSVKNYPAWYQE